MEDFKQSLNDEHLKLDRCLEEVVNAGNRARWSEYRAHFAAFKDGLMRHMAFEEDALYPVLEGGVSDAVKALRAEHAQIRQHLEMLGAAAPERDPQGCLAAIAALAELMKGHHAAEMAADPHYASKPIPQLLLELDGAIDLRGLQPPEPIVRIFQALDKGEAPLRVILPHEPVPLYSLLRERGYSYAGSPRADGGFEVLIERS
jgi:hypothetical protein